jgi:hypothetical protein
MTLTRGAIVLTAAEGGWTANGILIGRPRSRVIREHTILSGRFQGHHGPRLKLRGARAV